MLWRSRLPRLWHRPVEPGGEPAHHSQLSLILLSACRLRRVSTVDQNPDLQPDALTEAGCSRIFSDQASGSLADRPQLAAAMEFLRPGETLVVWRLDRLGRSLRHLVESVTELPERQVGFRSLQENIDTTATGRLMVHLFASLAELERHLIRERTQAGLTAARARGRFGGRKPVMTVEEVACARQMYDSQKLPVAEIARVLGVSRVTLYRHLGGSAAAMSTSHRQGAE